MNKLQIEIEVRHTINVLISDLFNARSQRDLTPLEDRSLDSLRKTKQYLDMGDE